MTDSARTREKRQDFLQRCFETFQSFNSRSSDFPPGVTAWAVCSAHFAESERSRDSTKSPAWFLVRALKAHPDLANLDPDEALSRLSADVGSAFPWSENPLLDVLGIDDATEADFVHLWLGAMRFPEGDDPLAAAIATSRRVRYEPRDTKDHRIVTRQKKCADLLSVAANLQVALGPDHPIALPQERLATGLDNDQPTISRHISTLRQLDLLHLHSEGSKARGRAAEYIVNMAALEELQADSSEEEEAWSSPPIEPW